MSQNLKYRCSYCRKFSQIKLQCCSECNCTYYCNKKCQISHWKKGDHKKKCNSEELLIEYHTKYPNICNIIKNLILFYERNKQSKSSQIYVNKLYKLKNRGKNPFKRCTFKVGKYEVIGYECFNLKRIAIWKLDNIKRRIRFIFKIFKNKKEIFIISLGCYDLTNITSLNALEKTFHLDGYFKKKHVSYKFYTGCPSWKRVKRKVQKILDNMYNGKSPKSVINIV